MGQINRKWKEFKSAVLADIEEPTAYEETVFYGGAASTMSVVKALVESDLPPDEVVAQIKKLHREILDHSTTKVEIEI